MEKLFSEFKFEISEKVKLLCSMRLSKVKGYSTNPTKNSRELRMESFINVTITTIHVLSQYRKEKLEQAYLKYNQKC